MGHIVSTSPAESCIFIETNSANDESFTVNQVTMGVRTRWFAHTELEAMDHFTKSSLG